MPGNPHNGRRPHVLLSLFELGRLVVTPGVIEAFRRNAEDPFPYLQRHARCDWGEVDREDWKANNQALVDDGRLLSAYRLQDGTKIWIVTEADRSSTTILLPDEY